MLKVFTAVVLAVFLALKKYVTGEEANRARGLISAIGLYMKCFRV